MVVQSHPKGALATPQGVVVVEVMIPFFALCLNLKMMLGKENKESYQRSLSQEMNNIYRYSTNSISCEPTLGWLSL